MKPFSLLFASVFAVSSVFAASAADAGAAFDHEEIKPYIKIMNGPWVGNSVSGRQGAYILHVQIPKNASYALGLFDNRINRTGADQRSAAVLVDGVNPLVPSEKIPLNALDGADVSAFRKYPLDGTTYTARDVSGKDAFVKVADAKEEWEIGAVRPFSNAKRIDIAVFAAPALPAAAGERVEYGAPIARYTIFLGE